ncbi:MAG: serine protein kinase, partial [Gemmatimonadetes bacterium]|nr:serine protein kinase [Gemmatimonadota bacterium]
MSSPTIDIIERIREHQNAALFQDLHWEGTFPEYLEIVRDDPRVARSAFQRLYDMIVSFGTRKYTEYKKEITHYNFFDDPIGGGRDAIFGLDVPLMKFVQVIKAAAMGYGPERRVILLHGPVGSSKSTIARLLKKGLEHYSRTPDGRLYTYSWVGEG